MSAAILTCLFSDLNLLDVVFVHDLLEAELDLLVSVLVVAARRLKHLCINAICRI